MNDDIVEIVAELEVGIDVGKETVIGLHEMETKLHAISAISAQFMDEGEFVEFLTDVSELIWDLFIDLKMKEDGELHLVAEEQAAKKLGRTWSLKHIARVKTQIREETEHEKRIIQIITEYMEKINNIFEDNKEEFHEDAQIHALCQKIHRLFAFYLKLFRNELKRLTTL
jgi:hypothetical protein